MSELEKGDVITFSIGDGKTATHRIEEVIGEGDNKSFKTKGDANDSADGKEVLAKDVIGVCVFSVPFLGYVVDYIQSQMGIYVSVGVVALIVILMVLPDILFGEEEKSKKTKKGKKQDKTENGEETVEEQAENSSEESASVETSNTAEQEGQIEESN